MSNRLHVHDGDAAMCDHAMCPGQSCSLTIETLIDDPLTRLVMLSDRISAADMIAVWSRAREHVIRYERAAA